VKWSIRITANGYDQVLDLGASGSGRESGTRSASGTNATFTPTCPAPGAAQTIAYTATATELSFFINNGVFRFEKK
jgi:hypothetical protein